MLRFLLYLRYITGVLAVGMLILSCIESTSPEDIAAEEGGGYLVVGQLMPTGYVQDVIVVDSYAYLAEGQGGFAIINVGDPQHPQMMSELLYETSGYARKLAYTKDTTGTEIAYCADGAYGVASIDVTDKSFPVVAKKNNGYKPAISLIVFKNYLFTAVNADGIDIAPFEDPKFPLPALRTRIPGYGRCSCISSDSTYLLIASGQGGVNMMNIDFLSTGAAVPDSPAGRFDLPGSAEWIVIIPGTKYACVACGTAGLQIVDYSDTANIKLAGACSTGGYAQDVCVAGDRAYLAAGAQGVQIIDIADITSPRRIGKVSVKDVRAVDVSNGYVYAGDRFEGLIIIKIPGRIP